MRKHVRTLVLTLTLLLCLACAVSTLGQAKQALLIANGDYDHHKSLPTPVSESLALAAALESIGFAVTVLENASREEMLDALYAFETALGSGGEIALFHYGGHGVQVDGVDYLIPATANVPDERRVATRCVPVDEIMHSLESSGCETSIVILDACRDNPLPESARSLARGLAQVVATKPENSLIAYSAGPGQTAKDGLFTPILTKYVVQPGLSILEVLQNVRREVKDQTDDEQIPGNYDELVSMVYLAGTPPDRTDDEEQGVIYEPTIFEVEQVTSVVRIKARVSGTLYVGDQSLGQISAGEEILVRNVPVGSRRIAFVTEAGRQEVLVDVVADTTSEVVVGSVLASASPAPAYPRLGLLLNVYGGVYGSTYAYPLLLLRWERFHVGGFFVPEGLADAAVELFYGHGFFGATYGGIGGRYYFTEPGESVIQAVLDASISLEDYGGSKGSSFTFDVKARISPFDLRLAFSAGLAAVGYYSFTSANWNWSVKPVFGLEIGF